MLILYENPFIDFIYPPSHEIDVLTFRFSNATNSLFVGFFWIKCNWYRTVRSSV